jgi:hypothetical protein
MHIDNPYFRYFERRASHQFAKPYDIYGTAILLGACSARAAQ